MFALVEHNNINDPRQQWETRVIFSFRENSNQTRSHEDWDVAARNAAAFKAHSRVTFKNLDNPFISPCSLSLCSHGAPPMALALSSGHVHFLPFPPTPPDSRITAAHNYIVQIPFEPRRPQDFSFSKVRKRKTEGVRHPGGSRTSIPADFACEIGLPSSRGSIRSFRGISERKEMRERKGSEQEIRRRRVSLSTCRSRDIVPARRDLPRYKAEFVFAATFFSSPSAPATREKKKVSSFPFFFEIFGGLLHPGAHAASTTGAGDVANFPLWRRLIFFLCCWDLNFAVGVEVYITWELQLWIFGKIWEPIPSSIPWGRILNYGELE